MPYFIIGALVLAILSAFGGYGKGLHDGRIECKIEQAEMVKDSTARKEKEARKATRAATKVEVTDAASRTLLLDLTKKVDGIVSRPLYQRECLDADGLRDIATAIAGAGPAAAQSDAALPTHSPP